MEGGRGGKEEGREGGREGGREEGREGGKKEEKKEKMEDVHFNKPYHMLGNSVTPSYLNQFEQVLKVLFIIHCDPTPFISSNTIMLHLVFITVCTRENGGVE